MQFEIKNRLTGKVQFTAEIDADDSTPLSVKIGLAVRWGYKKSANLRDADLSGADLRGADFRGVPTIPNIHQTVYAAASAPGALEMGAWHTCDTTHCRAGWVVILAGDAGAAMEFCMGAASAAALIYIASDPKLEKIPDFYATNADALADMKRLAEQEASS